MFIILLAIAALASVFYLWQKHAFNYWQRHGVKHIKPKLICGNMGKFLTGQVPFFGQIEKLHNEPGFENEPLIGVYLLNRPGLVIRDLNLVKTIMIKEFKFFSNRALRADPIHDPLGYNNLFFVPNPDWKELRTKISPVFTSGKIKQMYPLMVEIAKELETNLDRHPLDKPLAVKNLCSRFTSDLIATIAFGLKANALSDKDSEFYKANMRIFEISFSRAIDLAMVFFIPALVTLARVKLFSEKTTKFIRNTVTFAINERAKSGIQRNDLIDILLAMKRQAEADPDKSNKANDMDYLIAQAAIFQTAGFETSSSTMTLTLFELALNMEIQERLRAEVAEYFGQSDEISYERIQEMPYLTMVVNETLRKYPIVGYAERQSTQLASGELFSLSPYYNMKVPNGMPVYVSTMAIHRDEKYWPDPEKYDPERFAPENRNNINMDAYMPFGIGPHNCIGMRLGLLQTKLGLVHLLRNHRVGICDKTPSKIVFEAKCAVVAAKDEVVLKLERETAQNK